MTNQPKWKCIAQIGDINPLEYGGNWIFIDETNTYQPESEKLLISENEKGKYIAYRYCLDKCKMINGFLVPAKYTDIWSYPLSSYDEWYHKELINIAKTFDMQLSELELLFCSDSPIDRALAYETLGEYYGYENLDSYPLIMTKTEAKKRYGKAIYRKAIND
jgi:hypothetical protein